MKKLIACLITAMLALGCVFAQADEETVNIYVNDQPVVITDAADKIPLGVVVGAGTTMVRARVVTEALGCTVTWDEASQGVVIANDTIWFAMKIGSTDVYDAAGNKYTLPEAPILYNDEITMMPVRFISEQMGLPVEWDQTTGTVFINSEVSFKNVENSPLYHKTQFDEKLAQIKQLNETGDYYGAQSVISSTTQDEISAAQTLEPTALGEFYVQKGVTERNVALMAAGQPNDIEAELLKTREYLDNAEALYNKRLYYEAENALGQFYTMKTTPALMDEYQQLLDDIRTQIDKLPYDTLKDIEKVIESGDYYGAHARITAFLAQTNLPDDLRKEAEGVKEDIEQSIKNYERSQQVVGYRYVTNVSHGVNFHQTADEKSQVLATVPYGTRVDYVEMSDDFARVKYNNMYGYIMNFYLTQIQPPTQASAMRYIDADGVSIMGQPKDGAKAEMAVPKDAAVGLIEVSVNGYARIDYNGTQGYVLRTQLRENKE